jgi:hypothetical protein
MEVSKFRLNCHFCGSQYKTRTNLEKHVILCELKHKANHSKSKNKCRVRLKEEEEEEELPSQRKLYQMVLLLNEKYNRLEEKVEEMNKWIVKKKKKINVIEWLNNNIKTNL